MWRIFICLLWLGSHLKDLDSACTFEPYLYTVAPDGSDQPWISEARYKQNTETLLRQHEITVQGREISVKLQSHGHCTRSSCLEKETLYRRVCLRMDEPGKFRVKHIVEGKRPMYTCVKFVPRNKHLVQLWEALAHSRNEPRLCNDEALKRQEWPWIRQGPLEWSPCPISGGFDFSTSVGQRKKRLCKKEWLPSRMESECIVGEGLRFRFPDKTCSPFQYVQYKELLCWASWKESGYTFIVAGVKDANQPQYVLRLPTDPRLYRRRHKYMDPDYRREFRAHLYFSVITPISAGGQASTRVMTLELRMKRSEPGMCFDESDRCVRYALEGKCTNSALHEYANYCKRSCGHCGVTPPSRPECAFPDEFQGHWFLFEKGRMENITIHSGTIVSSHMGRFICKGVYWSQNMYKLLSEFTNGCRPRYTCVKMKIDHSNEKFMKLQIAKSTRTDESFDKCHFQDDPPPVADRFRSRKPKLLIPRNITSLNDCGLNGTSHVYLETRTKSGHHRCKGALSDWDSEKCVRIDSMSFLPSSCLRGTEEFRCVARIHVDGTSGRLITKDPHERQFTCWGHGKGVAWEGITERNPRFLVDSPLCPQARGMVSP